MNSKKIFISIFIIIAIVFMTANVFAYTMKENISTSSGAEAKRASENFRNLKLTSASFDRNTTNSVCKLTLTFDRTISRTTFTIGGYSAVGVLINEKPSMESRRAYGSKMDAIVSSTIIANNDSDKILTNSSYPQFIDPDYKAIIFWHRLGERTLTATYNCAAITSNNVDVYIFRPERSGAGKLNNVYLYDKEKDNIRSLDLRSDSSLLAFSNNLYYLYNVDYAYNLPVNVISQTNRDFGNQSGNSAASIRASSTSTSTAIPCDSSFRTATELGYQASWSYKCTDDKTGYYKCENGVSHGPYTFSRTSKLKPLICTSESTETIESTTTTETSQNKVVLTIENNTNISDINYSLDNTNWYSTKKIDFPKSFILGNKTNNKTINVDLDMFTEGTIYAIVSTVDKKTEIDNELKTIYQTGNFTGYNLQTASNVFEINNTLSLSKLQYTLDNTKKVKLNISNNITNGDLVIIFMQKSQDNSKVNLVYSNLYVLDEKEQSQYYLCEINKKIVSFYCRGHNCNLNISCMKTNRWDFDNGLFVGLTPRAVEPATPTPTGPQEVQSPVSSDNCSIDTQTTVEEYITCLRNNIETVNLTRSYALVVGGVQQGSAVVGNTLINNKYNTNRLCETSQSFNDAVFTGAKNANLTEEETAQLWSRLASESGCNSGVGCGDYCDSHGIAQINMTGWNNSSSYNLIKPYLVTINSSKYDTFAKFQSRLSNVTTDITSSVEISIAINKYHKSVILNKSRNATKPFTDLLDKTYDHNDAIDMQFATAYTYTGVAYADHFSDGIKVGNTRYQGVVYPALHKMGYYLTYKRMIYNCHKNVTTNAFVTAYKTKYQGSYCK